MSRVVSETFKSCCLLVMLLGLGATGSARALDVDGLVAKAEALRAKVSDRYTRFQDKLNLKGQRFQGKIDGSDAEKQEELRIRFQEKLDALIIRFQERGDVFRDRVILKIQRLNEKISEEDATRTVSTTGLSSTLTPVTLTAVPGGGGGGGGTGLGGGAENGALLTEQHFYLLQPDALGERASAVQKISSVNADTFILDAYFDPPLDAGQFTSVELDQIRAGGQVMGGSRSRVMLAYLSIGEAEDYRPYWQTEWDTNGDGQLSLGPDGNVASNVPDWLLNKNPKFPDNYPVKYWDPEWQGIIFGAAAASLDRIIAQGFDGVYLDIVDGFETFENGEDNKVNPVTGNTYRQDMINFVKALAAYARTKKPGFLVVPQNGSQLVDSAEYLAVVSGIGQEDLYFDGNTRESDADVAAHRLLLDKVKTAGKAVLVTDYPTRAAKKKDAIDAAALDKYSIFIGIRDLNTLGTLP